jgi:hypothetical protein
VGKCSLRRLRFMSASSPPPPLALSVEFVSSSSDAHARPNPRASPTLGSLAKLLPIPTCNTKTPLRYLQSKTIFHFKYFYFCIDLLVIKIFPL